MAFAGKNGSQWSRVGRASVLVRVSALIAAVYLGWRFVSYLSTSSNGIDGQSFGNVLVQCFYRSYVTIDRYHKTRDIADLTVACGTKGFFDPQYPTDKCSEHRYLHIYNQTFAPFRQRDIILVEIGVKNGGSLKLWRDYFSPKSRIFGVDVNQGMSTFLADPNIKVLLGDSKRTKFPFFKDNCVDIFIDDGYHAAVAQVGTLDNWFDYLCPGALYVIEDVIDQNHVTVALTQRNLHYNLHSDPSGQSLMVIQKMTDGAHA